MNLKKKIFLKILYFAPFYVLLILVTRSMKFQHWSLGFIIGLGFLISAVHIFSNVFDYDFFNDIEDDDYLSSSHKAQFSFDLDKWNRLKSIEKVLKYRLKLVDDTDDLIRYEIPFRRINSTLEFRKVDGEIYAQIEKDFFKFLPDKAVNYKILRRVMYEIEK